MSDTEKKPEAVTDEKLDNIAGGGFGGGSNALLAQKCPKCGTTMNAKKAFGVTVGAKCPNCGYSK